jgi:glucosamine--fructose-6-phosphate aminotransferase (isomerizing)
MQQDNTGREIATQVDAWNDAHKAVTAAARDIESLWRNGSYDSVIFTGCGSTHYLSMIAANLLQKATRVSSRAVPASELLLHPDAVYAGKKPLLVAVSRSATTTETIQAVENFKRDYSSDVVVISCYDDKPLNALATVNLAAPEGQEISVAQTRSFSAMLIMAEGLAAHVNGQAAPAQRFADAAAAWVDEMGALAPAYADPARFERVFYLGSGARYGLACEGMLKMKEMSLTSAEAFHTMEFRHGPKSMVDDKTLVIGLIDEQHAASEMPVLREVAALGATTLSFSTSSSVGADIVLNAYAARPSLAYYLPFVQWLAYLRATHKGLNPDKPRHLDQVVIL